MTQPAPHEQGDDDQGASAERLPAPPDPPPIRASDAEREQVAEVVRQAVSDGRLTIVEGDERLRDVYAARFRRDLTPVTADLGPVPSGETAPARRPLGRLDRPSSTTSVAVLSGVQKRGDWTPGHTHRVLAFWGGADLTFRDARLDDAGLVIGAIAIMGGVNLDLRGIPAGVEVTVQAVAIMGGVDVTVDPETTVVEDGFGFMGAFDDGSGPPRGSDGPRVRVTGLAFMGGVSVSRKPLALDGRDDPDQLER
ncbi:hypothetical protein Acsp06_47870 [Actinomycetospora sp. NBRC 106375]|uniref:DUF1707 SHOCT-like domain-containing protein n=1 Tax=Actinomycetospora sp. NBRC 106375 TaxID=3032207 RepID=UPI0024A3A3A6|nr:DUF1707 domain-containing protein [Actinomycetospora sp. NBRC 106375]GLZ48602.1 hypothetical protein Acsp06_47870 [Actinomycetospora sp. NBRC 106375]